MTVIKSINPINIVPRNTVLTATFIVAVIAAAVSLPAAPAAALSAQELLTNPVDSVTDTVGQATGSDTTQTTVPAQTTPTTQSVTDSSASTETTPASSPVSQTSGTDTSATQPIGPGTTTVSSTQSASRSSSRPAADQAIGEQSSVLYGSGKISQRTASNLYRIAGIAGLTGIIMYALSVLVRNGGGNGTRTRIRRMVPLMHRRSFGTKAGR